MNAEKEKLLNDTYQKWMQAGLYDLPLDKINEFVDPKIMGYGTAIDEKVLSISEYKQLINRQREQAVGIEMNVEITPVFRSVTNQEDAAIFVDEIKVKMIIGSEKLKIFLRITTLFEYIDNNWIVVHWHGSIPTETKAEDDAWLVNEWKRKNAELEKLVAEKTEDLLIKNKELEIESALEKVRSSALSMKQPGDMVDVCRIISDQLELLGVNDIRNVQTAIINEQKVTYLNYQYFAAYKEGVIEETDFNKHPTVFAMVEEMKKSANSTFSGIMKGKELFSFREWRKQNHQFPDPILDEVDTAHYYFYSIGLGGLGLTTYKQLNSDGLEIFRRFHNVFSLAYRRFIDIEKAEDQAREAKIEAALEKVRAVAMSMNKPDDLLNICEVLFKEFQKLGYGELRNAMINIHNDKKGTFINYDYSDEIGKSINHLTYNIHPVIEKQIKQIRSANDAFSETSFTGKDLDEWKKFRNNIGEKADPRIYNITALYYYFYSIGTGSIGVSTFSQINEEKLILLKRFRNVFNLSYQRYLDIALAEAQTREAQIEAALERVRSRTMGMQKSEELKEVIQVVYKQFVNLKINVDHAGFVVDYTPRGDWHFWIADEQDIPSKITHPYFESVWANQFNEAKEKGTDLFATNLNFEEKNKFYTELLSYVPGLPEAPRDFYLNCPGLAASTVLLEKVSLYIENFSGTPYTEEENKILMRIGKVFQQTYTRFLDLQKAEAQAREAQIETALERVRSRSMAMHKSDELVETSDVLFQELNKLGIVPIRTGIGIIDDSKNTIEVWSRSELNDRVENKILGIVPTNIHPLYEGIINAWKDNKPFYSHVLADDELVEYYYKLSSIISYPTRKEYNKKEAFATFFFTDGSLNVISLEPLKDEECEIVIRFAKVFGQVYQRFLDLKKAEAQAREAQIELSLEKIRAQVTAMKESANLLDIVVTMRNEFVVLGHEAHYFWHMRWLPDKYEKAMTSGDSTRIGMVMALPRHIHGDIKLVADWEKSDKPSIVLAMDVETAINYVEKMITLGDFQQVDPQAPTLDDIQHIGGLTFIMARTTHGEIGFSLPGTVPNPSKEAVETLIRFASVFDLAYKRFEDLKASEHQHYEAQIELALERTRTKSMLMRHSNELKNISSIFHEQLLLLGIPSEFSYVWLPDEAKGEHQFWATWAEQNGTTAFKSKAVTYPLDMSEPYTAACFAAWKSDKPVHIIPVPSSEVHQFFATWEELLRGAEQLKPEFFPEGLFYAEAYMKYGCFGINIRRELKGDEGEILSRFTIEFERAYTRFLDLQKAEAQNKIIQAENERKTKELEDARQLQLSMLPRELPKVSNLDIAVYMKTATEVGGDYYDFHIQPDGTLNVLVGDATGHGMMSGMMVSIMKSFFIANRNNIELKQFFENSNVSIKDMQLGRLMMACIGVQITPEKVIATNAGMPSLLYFRNKSQKAGEFVINNMPLGAMKGSKYAIKEINYEKGDTLLLMSDGFAELKNAKDEQYGYPRIIEEFKNVVQKSSEDIVDHLKNSATEWMNGVEPDDDVTFVVIKVK